MRYDIIIVGSGPGGYVAAIRAAQTRLRPIVMTSLAFIAGVLPLAIATGAGANSRVAIGTGIIGGLAAYPVAVLFMNVSAAAVAFYAYIIPFLISTVAGSVLAGILVAALKRTGALKTMGAALEQ